MFVLALISMQLGLSLISVVLEIRSGAETFGSYVWKGL